MKKNYSTKKNSYGLPIRMNHTNSYEQDVLMIRMGLFQKNVIFVCNIASNNNIKPISTTSKTTTSSTHERRRRNTNGVKWHMEEEEEEPQPHGKWRKKKNRNHDVREGEWRRRKRMKEITTRRKKHDTKKEEALQQNRTNAHYSRIYINRVKGILTFSPRVPGAQSNTLLWVACLPHLHPSSMTY